MTKEEINIRNPFGETKNSSNGVKPKMREKRRQQNPEIPTIASQAEEHNQEATNPKRNHQSWLMFTGSDPHEPETMEIDIVKLKQEIEDLEFHKDNLRQAKKEIKRQIKRDNERIRRRQEALNKALGFGERYGGNSKKENSSGVGTFWGVVAILAMLATVIVILWYFL